MLLGRPAIKAILKSTRPQCDKVGNDCKPFVAGNCPGTTREGRWVGERVHIKHQPAQLCNNSLYLLSLLYVVQALA